MTTQPWQEEFIAEFTDGVDAEHDYYDAEMTCFKPQDYISFISDLISKERADEREKTIWELVDVADKCDDTSINRDTVEMTWHDVGYNKAKKDIIEAIANLK